MADEPLRINIEVNASDVPKLAEAAEQVATSVKSMAAQFLAGSVSAKDIAAATAEFSSQLVESNATIQGQISGITEIKNALSGAQTAFKESNAIIAEAGGIANTTAGFQKNLAVEAQNVATLQAVLKEATTISNEALQQNALSAGVAGEAHAAMGAQVARASEAVAVATEQADLNATALKEQGETAITTGTAIVEGSESVQKASAAFLELERNVAAATATMRQAKTAYLEAVPGTDAAAIAANKYAAALTDLKLAQRDAAAAEAQLKTELSASYAAFQSRSAATASAAVAPAASTGADAITAAQQQKAVAVDAAAAAEQKLVAAEQELDAVEAKLSSVTALSTEQLVAQEAAINKAYGALVASAEAQARLGVATQQAVIAEQAAADAKAQDAAASEGMVASEVELAAAQTTQAQSSMTVTEAEQNLAIAKQNRMAVEQSLQAVTSLSSEQLAVHAAALDAEHAAENDLAVAKSAQTTATETQTTAETQSTTVTLASAQASRTQATALRESSSASLIASNNATQMVKTLLSAGASAKEIASTLKEYGFSAQQAAAAMNELGVASEKTGVAIEGAGASAGGASTKIDALTKALAYSSARLASNELGVGQLGFALARVGQISQTLAPILAAAFPVFAVFALFQILDIAEKKLEEWAQQAEKVATENAKFERSMLKSADAVTRMNEKLAGAYSPLAETAIAMASLGSKVIDTTSDFETLNKLIESDIPSTWTQITSWIGKAWESINLFGDAADVAKSPTEDFNRTVADGIKTFADVQDAVDKLKNKIKELQEQEAAATAMGGWESQTGFEDLQKRELQAAQILTDYIQTSNLERLSMQQSLDEKLLSEQTKTGSARLAYEASEMKSLTSLGMRTADQEKIFLENNAREEEAIESRLYSTRLSALKVFAAQYNATQIARKKPTVDFGPAEEALGLEQTRLRTELDNKLFDIDSTYLSRKLAQTISTGNAEIDASKTISESLIRLDEEKAKQTFAKADVPTAETARLATILKVNAAQLESNTIESAAASVIANTTAQYDTEIKALEEKAALQEKIANTKLEPIGLGAPTAKLGTDQYAEQLKAIQAAEPAIYAELLKMNSDEIALRNQQAAAVLGIENEKWDKIKEYYSQALGDQIGALNDMVAEEKTRYQEGATAIKTSLDEKRITQQGYFAAIKSLAESNYAAQKGFLDQEVAAAYDAYNQQYISATELQRRLNEINKAEIADEKQKWKEILAAAKEEIDKEESTIKSITNKISEDFTQAFNKILTTHESVGQAAKKLGAELELYIIDQGIKQVVTKYTQELLQMVAAHKIAAAQEEVIEAQKNINQLASGQIASIQSIAQQTQQTISHQAAVSAQTLATKGALSQQEALESLALTQFLSQQSQETLAHQASETAMAGATAAGQAAQTTAVAAGSSAKAGFTLIADLKTIINAAAASAAKAYEAVMASVPPPANLVLAPVAAAATFVAVAAYKAFLSGEGGIAGVGNKQPVLVHSGEIITHQDTITALNSPASSTADSAGASTHGMTVEHDQVTMLSPGMVVVPKAFAGDLANTITARGGAIEKSEGTTPPSGIREIPQRLPSSMASTLTSVISANKESVSQTEGGSMFQKVATASEGYVLMAREGFVSSTRDVSSAREGFVSRDATASTSSAKEGFISVASHDTASAREGYIFAAREGFILAARDGFIFSAKEGFSSSTRDVASADHGFVIVSAREGFSTSEKVATAKEGFISSAKEGLSSTSQMVSAERGFVISAKDGFVSEKISSAHDGFSVSQSYFSAKDGLISSSTASAREGYVLSAKDGIVFMSAREGFSRDVSSAKEGFVISAKEGAVTNKESQSIITSGTASTAQGFLHGTSAHHATSVHHAKEGYVFSAREGFVSHDTVSSAKEGYISSARDGFVLSARDGFVSSSQSVASAKEGFVVSAREGFVSAIPSASEGTFIAAAGTVSSQHIGSTVSHAHSMPAHQAHVVEHKGAREGFVFSAKEGFLVSAREGFSTSSASREIATAHDGFVMSAKEGVLISAKHGFGVGFTPRENTTQDTKIFSSASEGFVTSAKEGVVVSAKGGFGVGFVPTENTTQDTKAATHTISKISSGREGLILSARDGLVLSAKEGFVSSTASAREGTILTSRDSMSSAREGYVASTSSLASAERGLIVSARDGLVTTHDTVRSAKEGYLISARDGLILSGHVASAREGYSSTTSAVSSADRGLIVSAKDGFSASRSVISSAREGYVFSARDGFVSTSSHDVASAKEGFVISARDGLASSSQKVVSARDGFVSSSQISSAREGYVLSAKEGHVLTARDGLVFSARDGFVSSTRGIFTGRDGFVSTHDTASSAREGYVSSAREGFLVSAKEGYAMPTAAIASAAEGANFTSGFHPGIATSVVPANYATFKGVSLPGGPGGPGGIGGPGGPGGAGGDAGAVSHTVQHNNFRLEMHNHGGPMTPDDVTKAVKRALRRGNLP